MIRAYSARGPRFPTEAHFDVCTKTQTMEIYHGNSHYTDGQARRKTC